MYFQIIESEVYFYTSTCFNSNKYDLTGVILNEGNVKKALSNKVFPFGCNVNDTYVDYGWGEYPQKQVYLLREQCVVWDGLPHKVLNRSARITSKQDLLHLAKENSQCNVSPEVKAMMRMSKKRCRRLKYNSLHYYKTARVHECWDIRDALQDYPEFYPQLVKLKKTKLREYGDVEDGYITKRQSKCWKDQRKARFRGGITLISKTENKKEMNSVISVTNGKKLAGYCSECLDIIERSEILRGV